MRAAKRTSCNSNNRVYGPFTLSSGIICSTSSISLLKV